MFRDLIPELADDDHVAAPDLPGFGMTEQPERQQFAYMFGNIANVIGRFTEVLGLTTFIPPGAEAFKRDVPSADIRSVDTGHLALETHAREIGAAMRVFLAMHVA